MKKKIFVLIGIILMIIVSITIYNLKKVTYFSEISYQKLEEKIQNKENFILCLTKTTCTHCNEYKPKLKKVANKYKVITYYLETDKLTKKEDKKLKSMLSYNATPTTIFIKKGEEKTMINRLEGNVSSEKIIEKLKTNNYIK